MNLSKVDPAIFFFFLCRLSDLQKVHTSEVAKLQQCLQEETERRTQAQRSLDELRGEVAIGIDEAPLTATPSSGENQTPQTFSESLIIQSKFK